MQLIKRVVLDGVLFGFILAVLALPAAAADLSPISDFGPGEPGLQATFRQSARVPQNGLNTRVDARHSGNASLFVQQAGAKNSALALNPRQPSIVPEGSRHFLFTPRRLAARAS